MNFLFGSENCICGRIVRCCNLIIFYWKKKIRLLVTPKKTGRQRRPDDDWPERSLGFGRRRLVGHRLCPCRQAGSCHQCNGPPRLDLRHHIIRRAGRCIRGPIFLNMASGAVCGAGRAFDVIWRYAPQHQHVATFFGISFVSRLSITFQWWPKPRRQRPPLDYRARSQHKWPIKIVTHRWIDWLTIRGMSSSIIFIFLPTQQRETT